jgi:hypothetical protein
MIPFFYRRGKWEIHEENRYGSYRIIKDQRTSGKGSRY